MWEKLIEDNREYIKNSLLALLASDDATVVKSAAHCISSIGTIAIPSNEWPDLIDKMVFHA